MKEFDFTATPASDRYRLLTNFIGPRPIALVTTRSAPGHDNAAPMSFFNVFAQEPPLVILGIQMSAMTGEEKDTVKNIRRTGEFVVNMVDMNIAEKMVVCGINFPPDVDEVKAAGLSAAPCRQVQASRIVESPCAMECKVERIIDFDRRAIIFGEVVHMHVREDCLDAEGRYVRPENYQPIARLHADNYVASNIQFELKQPDLKVDR